MLASKRVSLPKSLPSELKESKPWSECAPSVHLSP